MSEQVTKTTTYRRPRTDEAREKANAYRRKYRAEHPDRVRRWRDNYVLKRAAKLVAAAATGDDDNQTGGGLE